MGILSGIYIFSFTLSLLISHTHQLFSVMEISIWVFSFDVNQFAAPRNSFDQSYVTLILSYTKKFPT